MSGRPLLYTLLVSLALGACGSGEEAAHTSTCTGTVSGAVTGPFTCLLQASYAAGSVLTLTVLGGPMATSNIALAFRAATPFTVRSYALADLQSAQGQLVNSDVGVFQVDRAPPTGTASFTLTRVDASRSTDEADHYGLSGVADATMVDATKTTTKSVALHFDF